MFFILELNLSYMIGLKKKKIEIRVCYFNCVNYMVCLINNGGIENRILIQCNRTDLRDNYATPFTDDYVSDFDSDSIAEFEKIDGQSVASVASVCFTESTAYKFLYTRL